MLFKNFFNSFFFNSFCLNLNIFLFIASQKCYKISKLINKTKPCIFLPKKKKTKKDPLTWKTFPDFPGKLFFNVKMGGAGRGYPSIRKHFYWKNDQCLERPGSHHGRRVQSSLPNMWKWSGTLEITQNHDGRSPFFW